MPVRKVSGGVTVTVAGTGTPGSLGDGGPATSAQLNTPEGVAVDTLGNLYIADFGNDAVRKVSNGVLTTVFVRARNGSCPASPWTAPATCFLQRTAFPPSANCRPAERFPRWRET